MKTLVTGGAGFIGSAVVHRLARDGGQIVTVDKLTYAANPLTVAELGALPGHSLARVDVTDALALGEVFAAFQPDAVIHLAAESHVDRSIDDPGAFVRTNVQGTFTVLDCALRHWERLPEPRRSAFRLVHVSTDEVYGSLGAQGAFSETSAYAPNSPYAASKAAADHLARAWFQTYGLPVVVTNCSNNYGPRQYPEKLIPLLILRALAGQPLPVYGDGLNVRDWLHVEDHAEALCLVARQGRPGRGYMIGGAAERTNLEVVGEVCRLLDALVPDSPHRPHQGLVTHVPDRPGHDRRYGADFSRIEAELGWRPSRDWRAGLEQTVRWYLDNPAWCDACGQAATTRRGLK
jgi:dTDP-glucose 4,6-dehydratase